MISESREDRLVGIHAHPSTSAEIRTAIRAEFDVWDSLQQTCVEVVLGAEAIALAASVIDLARET